MNMKLGRLLLAIALTAAMRIAAVAQSWVTIDGVVYAAYDNDSGKTAVLESGEWATIANFTIPETIEAGGESYPVEEIKHDAFNGNTTLESITFSKNLKRVKSNAFAGCSNLQSVNWYEYTGSNIESIDAQAFMNCKRLKSIWIPENFIVIPAFLFYGCDSLKTVYISCPELTAINRFAFWGCEQLTSVYISAPKLTTIGQSAFSYCTELTRISLPGSVTTIEESAFYSCKNLADITLPRQLRTIGVNAFGYTKPMVLDIPDVCETIEKQAFSYAWLRELTLPGELKTLGEDALWSSLYLGAGPVQHLYVFQATPLAGIASAVRYYAENPDRHNLILHVPRTSLSAYQASEEWSFAKQMVPCDTLYDSGCRYQLNVPEKRLCLYKHTLDRDATVAYKVPSTVQIRYGDGTSEPYAVTGIGGEAFKNMSAIVSVDLQEVDSIGYGVFSGCSALTTIKTEKLRYIGQRAFEYCSKITVLDLPATLEKMEGSAFVGCRGIESVTVRAAEPPATYYGAFNVDIYSNATLYVPAESLEQYRAANGWKEFVHIEAIVDAIKGDINGDKSVDGNDVSALLEMVLAGGVTDAQKSVADVNGDNSVDGNDVSALLEMVLAGE